MESDSRPASDEFSPMLALEPAPLVYVHAPPPPPYPKVTMEDIFEALGHMEVWFMEDPPGPWGPGTDTRMSILGIADTGRLGAFAAIVDLFVTNEGLLLLKLRKPDTVMSRRGTPLWASGQDTHLCFTVTDGFGKPRCVTLYDNYEVLSATVCDTYTPDSDKAAEACVMVIETHPAELVDGKRPCLYDGEGGMQLMVERMVTLAWATEHGPKPGLRQKLFGDATAPDMT